MKKIAIGIIFTTLLTSVIMFFINMYYLIKAMNQIYT